MYLTQLMRTDDRVTAEMAQNMHCNDGMYKPQLALPSVRRVSNMDRTSKRATKSVSTKRATTTHAASTVSSSAADFLPEHPTLESLHQAEQTCQGCELYQRATQAVGGEGPSMAEMVLVGETPGDEEDKTGHPFVGPAGALLE
jgi:hypothetical protein